MVRLYTTILFALFTSCGFANLPKEGYYWWNLKHAWNGNNHWTEYMRISPAYLAINALPIPDVAVWEINKKQKWSLDFNVNHSYLKGENTLTVHLYAKYSFEHIPIIVNIESPAFEYYATDTTVRDLRRARNKSGFGASVGDIWFKIQTFKHLRNFGTIYLTGIYKLPTGSGFYDARHIPYNTYAGILSYHSPAFYLPMLTDPLYVMLGTGIYVWEMNTKYLHSNDAFYFIASAKMGNLILAYMGYSGEYEKIDYIKLPTNNFPNRDNNAKMMLSVENIWQTNISFSYTYGLYNNEYKSFSISYKFH